MGGALVDEGLDIRLGEDAAARGDRVELGVAGRHLAEARRVGVQQGGHLVDKSAGAARARAVHALLGRGVQVGELGVLAAQLDDDVDLGVEALGGLGARDDLLNEGNTHGAGGRQAAGAGDGRVDTGAGQGALDVGEEGSQGCAHVCVVPAVVGEKAAIPIQNDGLDRRRADINAELIGARCLVVTLCCHEVPPGFSPQPRKPFAQSQSCPLPREGHELKPQNNRENRALSRCGGTHPAHVKTKNYNI